MAEPIAESVSVSAPRVHARRARKRPIEFVAPLLLAALLIVFWDVAQTRGWISDLLVPRPGEVAISTYELFATGLIWEHLRTTLFETVTGFLLAAVFAISLALAAGWSRTLRYMVQPYAVVLQVLPMISLAPIIISIFGFGTTSKVVVAALISFFPIFVNTLTGVLTPNPQAEDLFLSLGASRAKTFVHVLLPGAAPMVFAGLRIGLTLALAGAVVAEFVSAQVGLGLLVSRFSYQLNLDDAFAVIVVLTAMGLLLYASVGLLERFIVFWHRPSGLDARSKRRQRRLAHRLAHAPSPVIASSRN
ncbi:MAG TPA: ABC transporter permease [Candidatus Paceibacterota bacterium]|nr:ABC transporter permease [Candidatus Paceibacterota bacterium]